VNGTSLAKSLAQGIFHSCRKGCDPLNPHQTCDPQGGLTGIGLQHGNTICFGQCSQLGHWSSWCCPLKSSLQVGGEVGWSQPGCQSSEPSLIHQQNVRCPAGLEGLEELVFFFQALPVTARQVTRTYSHGCILQDIQNVVTGASPPSPCQLLTEYIFISMHTLYSQYIYVSTKALVLLLMLRPMATTMAAIVSDASSDIVALSQALSWPIV
jgi:hypothetical protein